ncbi:hypothetical protein I553_7983 [Mycobacterium xenopi 4042]|uniref:Uncharacterized protein n=1 Tax=Mycobacterium xenopi 4042 TaxID=1299334 RepID=X8DDD0_MYCXE|nr:hypothetical protein I553_7983 [Mycobacterium xenopi 4042]
MSICCFRFGLPGSALNTGSEPGGSSRVVTTAFDASRGGFGDH